MLSILFTEGVSDSDEFHDCKKSKPQCEDYPVFSPKYRYFPPYLESSLLFIFLPHGWITSTLKIVHCICFSFPPNRLKSSTSPGGASGQQPACQCRRCKRRGFSPWVGRIPRRRTWQAAPVALPGESYGQGAWQATVHGVTKSRTRLKWLSTPALLLCCSCPIMSCLRRRNIAYLFRCLQGQKTIGTQQILVKWLIMGVSCHLNLCSKYRKLHCYSSVPEKDVQIELFLFKMIYYFP